jgi:hypothetical protein
MKLKKLIIIILLLFIPHISYAIDFYVFGVNLKWIKNAESKDYGMMILGGITNFVVHESGHYLCSKIEGADIDFNRTRYVLHNTSPKQERNIARTGYIFDSIVGLGLTTFAKDSYFTKGYTMTNAIGLVTYDIRNKKYNDFNLIKKNNGNEELFKYSIAVISTHNLLRQEW